MKIRSGFVSNSSSSSFVFHTDKTANEILKDIFSIWVEELSHGPDVHSWGSSIEDFYSNVWALNTKNTLKSKSVIEQEIRDMYSKQYMDADDPIHYPQYSDKRFVRFLQKLWDKLFPPMTYLKQAMKGNVLIVAEENYIPYAVIHSVMEKYHKKVLYDHLG